MKISQALFQLLRFDRQTDIHGEVNIRISATLGMTLILNELGLFQLGVMKMKKCSDIRIRGVGARNANFRNTWYTEI